MESDADHAQGGSTGQVDPNQSGGGGGSKGRGRHKATSGKEYVYTPPARWEAPKRDWNVPGNNNKK